VTNFRQDQSGPETSNLLRNCHCFRTTDNGSLSLPYQTGTVYWEINCSWSTTVFCPCIELFSPCYSGRIDLELVTFTQRILCLTHCLSQPGDFYDQATLVLTDVFVTAAAPSQRPGSATFDKVTLLGNLEPAHADLSTATIVGKVAPAHREPLRVRVVCRPKRSLLQLYIASAIFAGLNAGGILPSHFTDSRYYAFDYYRLGARVTDKTELRQQPYDMFPREWIEAFAGGGIKLRICDLCGSRWKVNVDSAGTETLIRAAPKASPTSTTPLAPKSNPKAKSKAKAKAIAVTPPPAPPPPAPAEEGYPPRTSSSHRRSSNDSTVNTTARSKANPRSAPRSLYSTSSRRRQQGPAEYQLNTEESERGDGSTFEGSVLSSYGQRCMDQGQDSQYLGEDEDEQEEEEF
jgi:hypothetical protein